MERERALIRDVALALNYVRAVMGAVLSSLRRRRRWWWSSSAMRVVRWQRHYQQLLLYEWEDAVGVKCIIITLRPWWHILPLPGQQQQQQTMIMSRTVVSNSCVCCARHWRSSATKGDDVRASGQSIGIHQKWTDWPLFIFVFVSSGQSVSQKIAAVSLGIWLDSVSISYSTSCCPQLVHCHHSHNFDWNLAILIRRGGVEWNPDNNKSRAAVFLLKFCYWLWLLWRRPLDDESDRRRLSDDRRHKISFIIVASSLWNVDE